MARIPSIVGIAFRVEREEVFIIYDLIRLYIL
jgi:hypothetical protein